MVFRGMDERMFRVIFNGRLRFCGLNRFVFSSVNAGQGASHSWRVLLVEANKASQVT